jgi:hypothetical protein
MPELPPPLQPPRFGPADSRPRAKHRRLYKLAAYQRFRSWKLREYPVCQDCERLPSIDVHHKRGLEAHPEDLCDDDATLALCKGCHSVRTQRGE